VYKAPARKGRLVVRGDVNELRPWFDEVEKQDTVTRELFLWLLLTGNRLSEALGLRWEHIDWSLGEYIIHDTKGRQEAVLPVLGCLRNKLKARKKQAGPVVPVKGEARAARSKIAADIGKHWTNHDLRRTLAGIGENEVPWTALKRLMNHSLGDDITAQYVGDAHDLHDALERVERKILELAGRSDNVRHLKVVS
jgi:integrase